MSNGTSVAQCSNSGGLTLSMQCFKTLQTTQSQQCFQNAKNSGVACFGLKMNKAFSILSVKFTYENVEFRQYCVSRISILEVIRSYCTHKLKENVFLPGTWTTCPVAITLYPLLTVANKCLL